MKNIVMICFLILIQLYTSKVFALNSSPVKQDKKANRNTPIMLDNKAMKTFLDKIEIYGRIAKPQTVFIIPGADPRVDGIRIERRFFRDIFRNVEKSTLRKQKIKEQRNKDHLLW